MLKNWQTTLAGILGVIIVVIPPIKAWIETTTHLDVTAILALIVALVAALAKDHNVTGGTRTQ